MHARANAVRHTRTHIRCLSTGSTGCTCRQRSDDWPPCAQSSRDSPACRCITTSRRTSSCRTLSQHSMCVQSTCPAGRQAKIRSSTVNRRNRTRWVEADRCFVHGSNTMQSTAGIEPWGRSQGPERRCLSQDITPHRVLTARVSSEQALFIGHNWKERTSKSTLTAEETSTTSANNHTRHT